MPNREAQIEMFLEEAGWGKASRKAMPGDASSRRYEKLALKGGRAILMDAPQSDGGPSDYAVTAKLADGAMAAFTSIDLALTQRGFSAPKILAADIHAGLLLLEDLGDALVARVLENNPSLEREIYMAAMDTLAALYRCSFAPELNGFGHVWNLRPYDRIAMKVEVDLMLEWYLPYLGKSLTGAQTQKWAQIWDAAFEYLEAHAPGLALRDFHAENIFWLPERGGTSRIGLIDFQDGLLGHPAYDLVSLIEDARRDVDPSLTEDLIAHFCERAALKNDDGFRAAYAVIGAQRNAKILGIFVRLAKRDGKQSYLDLLPRVQAHFKNNLAHPALKDLRDFIEGL